MSAAHPRGTTFTIFRFPRAYDLLLRLLWGKSEHRYRRKLVDLAAIRAGEKVLDVGCGTGTLAIAAYDRAGPRGSVSGVDLSAEMIARARCKAAERGLPIAFYVAPAGSIPAPDGAFDAVLSSTVIHCLSEKDRIEAFREMARVLKPHGRLLIADYGGSGTARNSLLSHMKAHSLFSLESTLPALLDAGLELHDRGSLGFADLHFLLLGRTPCIADRSSPTGRSHETKSQKREKLC